MSSAILAVTLSAGALARRFHRWRSAVLLVSVALLPVCAAGTAQGDVWADYRQAAEARIATWEARRPGILVCGAYMVDLRTDDVILDVRSQDMLITASNMKLFTGAFALSELGPSFAFTTKVYLVGNDIVVIGDGDPTIGCEDLSAAAGETVYTELDRWADAIKTQAQPQFTGDLLLCSLFNLSGFHHPDKSNTTNPAWYSAPVDALNFHDNYYDVTFTVSGDTVTPNLVPASSFTQVINQLTRGLPSSWTLRSASDESTVTLSGTVPSSTTSASWVSGNHPAMLLGRTLADRIVLAGVPFSGAIQMVQFGDLDLSGAQLLYQRDTELADSMKRMNKRSLNMAANCHFLRAGDGTWAGSQALITTCMLDDYHLDPNGFNLIEGSGLFETCRAKPRVFVDLLTQMTEHPDGNILIESLPISGVDGTLQEQGRYPEAEYRGRVLGKTGTVGSASCLSGYILDAETAEPVVAFSILCNRTEWFPGYTWWDYARDMQDDIVKMLVDTVDALSDDEPPTITAWYSAGDHDRGVGEALLEIPDDGSFSEPRSSGIGRLVVEFSEAMDPVSFAPSCVELAALDSNNDPLDLSGVVIDTSLRTGDTVGVITFTDALPDYARYTARISGVTDVVGNALGEDNDRTMTALCGDVSGDLRVNATDFSRVRSARTRLVDSGNPDQVRADVSLDGRVNASDLSRIRARRGNDARGIADPVIVP